MDRFETPRLTAERLSPHHLPDLVALHANKAVSRFLGGVRSGETTRAYLADNIDHWDRHGFGLWVLRDREGRFAGRAGLRHVTVEGRPEVEIAYTFTQAHWGQGLASEITAALVDIGFTTLALPDIAGLVVIGNAASRRVLEKAGFELEGEVRFHDAHCVIYRLTNPYPQGEGPEQ
jgi:RimJ/RimL family protein N-acetyltransferase